MFSALFGFNPLSVVVAFIGTFLVGMVWYSPMAFGNTWMSLVGLTPEKMRKAGGPGTAMGMAIGANVAMCLCMAMAFSLMDVRGVPQGIGASLLLWLGFNGLNQVMHAGFEGRPMRLIAITASGDLVSMLVAGIVLSIWRS